MKKKILIFLILLSIISSCNTKSDIIKLTLASEGCHGTCSIMALEIDDKLNVKYYGGEFAKNKGNYRGKISEKYWSSLKYKLENSDYLKLNKSYENNNDFESIEIIIEDSKSKKHIKGFYNDMPNEFNKIIVELLKLPNSLNLVQTKDSLTFETTFQKAESRYGNGIGDIKFLPKNEDKNIK